MRPTAQTTTSSLLIFALAVLLPLGDRSEGQTFYRWTDERGIVHITDNPPQGVKYDTEQLKPPPPATDQKPAVATDGSAAETTDKDTATGEEKEASPARVIIEEQTNRSAGGSTKTFAGKTTNTGGTEARNVAIEITVTETVQGASCLRQRISVSPSALPPGESGSFSARLDNPCFHGPTDVQLTPRWD